MANIVCEITHVKKTDQTSLLVVKLNDIATKTMKILCKDPDDWIENMIISRCNSKCKELQNAHIKECIEENTHRKTLSTLLLDYEVSPEAIFQTKRNYSENENGTSEINVDIDPLFTKCMDIIFVNSEEEIKLLIQNRIQIQINDIINDSINKGINLDKTKREIIMNYEREDIIDDLFDEDDEIYYQSYINILSDDRIKFNETEISDSLSLINKIKPMKYEKLINQNEGKLWMPSDSSWNSIKNEIDDSGYRLWDYIEEIGLIAQDVKEIPELSFCVSGKETDKDGRQRPLSINYNNIFCVVIQAVKDLSQENQKLNNDIELIKTENTQLKSKNEELITDISMIRTHIGI